MHAGIRAEPDMASILGAVVLVALVSSGASATDVKGLKGTEETSGLTAGRRLKQLANDQVPMENCVK